MLQERFSNSRSWIECGRSDGACFRTGSPTGTFIDKVHPCFNAAVELGEERSLIEVFSAEKAGCPFRRSETRLFAEFAPFRYPRLVLPSCHPSFHRLSKNSHAIGRQPAGERPRRLDATAPGSAPSVRNAPGLRPSAEYRDATDRSRIGRQRFVKRNPH
jgi:hypothetical protein